MLFKKYQISLFLTLMSLQMVACTYTPPIGNDDDNIIGVSVDSVSNLNPPNESEAKDIVLFDQTVRRIHQFDLTKMTYVRSFPVNNPDVNHYVLYNNVGNYAIDLSIKGLSVFNRFGQADHDPIHFEGKPKSAAFHRNRGILIVYDDLMSVGMLKIDSFGNVTDSWVGGANIILNLSISSGDITDDGKLILSLSDNSIIVMDIEQSIAQKKWITATAPFSTALENISWLAPVQGSNTLILAKATSNIHLIDINSQAVVATYPIGSYNYAGTFKSKIPHIILHDGQSLKVVYFDGTTLTDRTFYLKKYPSSRYAITQSVLDLYNDSLSFVETTGSAEWFSSIKEVKTYKRYRVSDLLALQAREISAGVQTQIANSYIFNLYPSELGYATRQDLVTTGGLYEIKLFNVGYIAK